MVVMNCHVQQKVKVGKTVCDEASVVPWEVHSRDKVQRVLLLRKFLIHNSTGPRIPYEYNLAISLLCDTTSNALLKSMYTTITCCRV